ncbi:matrixin family metalloprotease [Peribacillus muralis]
MSASAATVKTLSWNLVDSGKHMDWDGSTKYQTQLNAGVKTLNGYKSGVIRKDTAKVIQDVAISDYSEKSSVAGVTSSRGTIKFNKYVMDTLTATKKQNVATHELGHALGLAHNTSSDVMYEYVSTKTSLSANDKASYAAAYKKY